MAKSIEEEVKELPKIKNYIYQCVEQKVIGLRGTKKRPDKIGGTMTVAPIRLNFDGHNCSVTDEWARQFTDWDGKELTAKDIHEMATKHDQYGKEFWCVVGPGISVEPEVLAKLERAKLANTAKVEVGQGARTTGDLTRRVIHS